MKTVYAQNVIAPNTLSNSIRMLGSQSPLIQAYGLIILQQPDIKVNAMSSNESSKVCKGECTRMD